MSSDPHVVDLEAGSDPELLPPRYPPLYTPSSPAPTYSQNPADDEIRLDLSLRTGRRARLPPTGIFTKAFGWGTIVLSEQEPGTKVPSYDREACVRGSLILEEDSNAISQVEIKLEGWLDITTSDAGGARINTVKMEHILWSDDIPDSSHCPGTLEFACNLPTTFRYGELQSPLPPSYIATFPGYPSLYTKSSYRLTVSMTHGRRWGLPSKKKSFAQEIAYHPENSPPSAICSAACFFSSVKRMPEEWGQSSVAMKSRVASGLSPIQCEVFIPCVRMFGLRDRIPLRIQISGPPSSLRELVPTTDPDHETGCDCGPIRVSLSRKVTVSLHGKVTWRVQRIGGGCLRVLPGAAQTPGGYHIVCDDQAGMQIQAIDWEGHVQCDPGVAVPSFHAAGLGIKDFVTVQLTPPKPQSSQLLPVQLAIPIRFSTQPFVEST